jgi:hypothetical protein
MRKCLEDLGLESPERGVHLLYIFDISN